MANTTYPRMKIEIELDPRVNLAAQQNSVPIIHGLTLTNTSEEDLEGLEIRIAAEPSVADDWNLRLAGLRAGATHTVSPIDLRLSPGYLSAQAERLSGRLEVCVVGDDGVLALESRDIEVLAANQWQGAGTLPQLLAAWVTPNHPALVPVLKAASTRLGADTGDPSLSGYQTRDPQRVAQIAQAIYLAVQATGVSYIESPASFESTGQKIRTPRQVLDGGMGNCMDLTALMASLMEQAGLRPLLVVIDGHAFPGVWLIEHMFHVPAIDDAVPLRNRVRLDEILVFDSSALAAGRTFKQARDVAQRHLADDDAFRFVVDVGVSRAHRILPLSLPEAGDPVEPAPAAPRPMPQERLEPVALTGNDQQEERSPRTARTRLDRWKSRLLDLTLRNKLLNFKHTKETLALSCPDLAALEDALADDKVFAVLPKLAALVQQDPRSPGLLEAQTAGDPHLAMLRSAQSRGQLHTDHTETETAKRLLEVYRLAKTAFDESGAITLYLALGMLRWYESDSSEQPRLAPLILVPVTLERGRGSQPYRLRFAEDETRVNATLLQKLEHDFGLEVQDLAVPPTDDSGVDVPLIMRRFRRLVLPMQRWEVLEDCYLARFSFTKFLMWLDLESNTEHLLENPVVRHVFEGGGTTFPLAEPLLDDADLDQLDPSDVYAVVDADPSQLKAIIAAADGSSFVLQGPPGTGKSQTITNLIAQVLGTGGTVLFVSEKMAALDVVHRRLEAVGLGPFCLELHSHKASKRAVVDQLARGFDQSPGVGADDWCRQGSELDAARRRLNEVAVAIGAPSRIGLSPYQLCSELIGLRDAHDVDFDFGHIDSWDVGRFTEAPKVVDDFTDALDSVGGAADHPFTASRLTEWTPSLDRDIKKQVEALGLAAQRATESAAGAASALGISPAPDGDKRLQALASLAESLRRSPSPPVGLIVSPGLAQRHAEAKGWLQLASERQGIWSDLGSRWRDGLLSMTLDTLHHRISRWHHRFFLIVFFALWGARRSLQTVSSAARLSPWPDVLCDVERARDVVALDTKLATVRKDARATLGPFWRGAETDVPQGLGALKWAGDVRRDLLALIDCDTDATSVHRIAELACERAEVVAAGTTKGDALGAFTSCWAAYEEARSAVVESLRLEQSRSWPVDAGPAVVRVAAQKWLDAMPRLRDWCAVMRAASRVDEIGFLPAVDIGLAGSLAPGDLDRAFKRSLFRWAWESISAASPALAAFRGVDHGSVIRQFRDLDERRHTLAQRTVVTKLAQRRPDLHAPGDEMALLRRQFLLQRRHMPIRRLFAQIPGTLRRLKPCVLMSPLSVAQYLDPKLEGFDLVVFDEASQIPPWDAIGAIARGSSVVVVGDSRQLPPTSFFDRGADAEDGLDDEDLEETESILDEAIGSGLQELKLRWHYRSRHESLIAFSNYLYYANELHTFPAAGQRVAGLGLELRPVPQGVYDRGKSRTNRAEADAVVAELLRLLRVSPDLRRSVGVVTFNTHQQRLIEDLVDAARLQDKSLDIYFADDAEEPVFIKNLENVQGDERDVMLFSICYGPDRTGRVAMNFGPLNRQGGERRLNVAVSRARERTVVFSTLQADQIDLRRTGQEGPKHLKLYLDYAKRGLVALDSATVSDADRTTESPFEAQVKQRLEAQGWQVNAQVGCSGYRVDLAVVHPERPGAYVLGVECDGATYHSSRNARERDRLRQMVLERLGWRLHRIWSTDWWLDPKGETQRVCDAVQDALSQSPTVGETPRWDAGRAHDTSAAPVPTLPSAKERLRESLADGAPKLKLPPGTLPYRVMPTSIVGDSEDFYLPGVRAQIGALLREVVELQGPIHMDEACRAVANCWGLERLGSRIRAQVEDGRQTLTRDERPRCHGDCYWQPARDPASWRGFRVPDDDPASSRDIHLVPPEELANAAEWILNQAASISREELQREIAAVFGGAKLGRRVREATESAVDILVVTGRGQADGDRIKLPT